jgi:glycosyltransferase involved in cell wall biosynthesis
VASIVTDGETGLLGPEGDAAEFAEAVGALLADPTRRAAMGRAAMERAARENDIASAAALLDAQLRRLTANA